MKLFVSGQKFKAREAPPVIRKIKTFLDKAKPGEMFFTWQLAGITGCSEEPLRSRNHHLTGYYHVYKNKKYWGAPATIRQLIKETSKHA